MKRNILFNGGGEATSIGVVATGELKANKEMQTDGVAGAVREASKNTTSFAAKLNRTIKQTQCVDTADASGLQ